MDRRLASLYSSGVQTTEQQLATSLLSRLVLSTPTAGGLLRFLPASPPTKVALWLQWDAIPTRVPGSPLFLKPVSARFLWLTNSSRRLPHLFWSIMLPRQFRNSLSGRQKQSMACRWVLFTAV